MRLTDLVTPLKPLEAMAQGRLLVASDVGGHRELIRDGETGVLFRAGDDGVARRRDRAAARRARALAATARAGPALRRARAQLGGQRRPVSRCLRAAGAGGNMNLAGLRIALVGPMPPPEGGMANQTRQLGELLRREGATVTVVAVNAAYRPPWMARCAASAPCFASCLTSFVFGAWRARPMSFTSWPTPAGRGICSRRRRCGLRASAASRRWSITAAARPRRFSTVPVASC